MLIFVLAYALYTTVTGLSVPGAALMTLVFGWFFGVVYGEYASRKAAGGSLDGLPEALRNISPIRRSVGGLREEIRRLGAVN